MKRFLSIFLCLVPLMFLFASEKREALKDLRRNGGVATFDLTVKDDRGIPVEDATGVASFWSPSGGGDNRTERLSDEQGHLVLSGRAYTDGNYIVKKDEHYFVRGHAMFDAPEEKAGLLERRCWVPVVEEVTLKRKINPIPMYAWRVRLPVPALDQPLPLDLEKMEWCAPYGEGEHEDMWVTLGSGVFEDRHGSIPIVKNVILEFRGDYNGVQLCNADTEAEFQSSYHTNTQAQFLHKLEFSADHYFTIPNDKYLAYRVRSKGSPEGELISAHYGKIYSSTCITTEEFSLFAVYFNPTENDTNLEFDPKRNLAKPDRRNKRERAWEP